MRFQLLLLLVFGTSLFPQTLDQAKREMQAGHYGNAANLFERENLSSGRCDALFYAGVARYKLGQFNPALIDFQAASACDPRAVAPRIAMAESYGQKRIFEKALAIYEQVLAMEPANLPALRGAASIYLEREENEKALPLLVKLVSDAKADARVHADLGAAYAAIGNREQARSEFNNALRLDSKEASAWMGLANLLVKEGDDAGSVALFEKAIAADPQAFEPQYVLGSVYNRLLRFHDAAKALTTAQRLGGERAEIFYQLARAYGGLGQEDERKRALSRFGELSREAKDQSERKRTVERLTFEAKTLIDSGDLTRAHERMEEAHRLTPNDGSVLFRLASLEYDLQKLQLARQHAEEATSLVPSEWLYHFLLGLIQKSSHDWHGAQMSFEIALRLNPAEAAVHNAAGELAMQTGDLQQAILDFQRAAQINPQEPSYRRNLELAKHPTQNSEHP